MDNSITNEPTIILSGKPVADKIKNQVKERVDSFVKAGQLSPSLYIIKTSNDPASESYIRGKIKDCKECGIACRIEDLSYLDRFDFFNRIVQLNRGDNGNLRGASSMIVQLPLNEKFKDLTNSIPVILNPKLDADCFTSENLYKMGTDSQYNVYPCTPGGIIELLHFYDIPIAGKNVVIIGRSDIVGKPLATMMTYEDATVTLCHSKTKNLKEYISIADIIVVAVGKAKMIGEEYLDAIGNKKDKVIIDVGINRNEDGKLCGDVDFDVISPHVKAITPVPGGIGLTTRAMLMRNVLALHEVNNAVTYTYYTTLNNT